jgi:hypothetical protein
LLRRASRRVFPIFVCIRNADLGRFTVDRLMSILHRLGPRVEVKVRVPRAEPMEGRAPS